MNEWFQFSKIDHLENYTFDNSLEHFRESILEDGGTSERTIREIIQNSMDAKNHEIEGPVHIEISITEVHKNILPGIDEIFSRIKKLDPRNVYTKQTVDYMKTLSNKEKVLVLTASDSNTKGLSGANSLDGGTYDIYAYNKGVHGVDGNIMHEKIRGGSHGVGKIANNAASDIHLMYFANTDEFGNKHLGGSVQLFDHVYRDKNYRGTGYFAKKSNVLNHFEAFENAENAEIFKKTDRGLKIIIPYLREEMNDESDIVKSICNNFFVAIIERKLTASIKINKKDILINSNTIDQLIEQYYPKEISEMKKEFLPMYVNTFKNQAPIEISVSNNLNNKNPFKFKLYFFDDNNDIPTGRVAIVRSIGMKIEDRKIPSHVRTPFNAVLVGGIKEDQYLKKLENESHTSLNVESIRDLKEKKDAKRFLNNLNKEIKKIIEKSISQRFEDDGKLNTNDLIFESKWEFNGTLQSKSGKVELANGQRLNINNKKERRNSPNNKSTDNNYEMEIPKRKRHPRKLQSNTEYEQQIVEYIVPSDIVDRLVLKNNEYLNFNFSELEEFRNCKMINLSYKLVTGEGQEIENNLKLDIIYRSAKETISDLVISKITSEKIWNIPIINGKCNLKFEVTQHFNSKFKYVYKVEVIE